ncbi:MAG: hypothetical protein KH177_06875 [Faecalibacterium prausnitzii]|jgi:hypothetical protein|nr:hypothetical protein [Faecalibacterium prausnitzii]
MIGDIVFTLLTIKVQNQLKSGDAAAQGVGQQYKIKLSTTKQTTAPHKKGMFAPCGLMQLFYLQGFHIKTGR